MIEKPFCQCGARRVASVRVFEIAFLKDFIHVAKGG
jgi:hypothetical protein